jgi:hypothetical protein
MGGQNAEHWEGIIIPHNVLIADAYEKGCPASAEPPKAFDFGSDRDEYEKLSINQWKAGIGGELARAAAYDLPAYDAAAKVVHDWLDAEDQAWWLNEQCVGGAHVGIHMQGELLALRGAFRRKDSTLIMRLSLQFRRFLAIGACVTSPSGVFVCVGERQEGSGPNLPQASALYRIGCGMPHRGPLAENPDQLHSDTFWLSARIATAAKAAGELTVRVAGAPMPRMRRQLTVTRWKGGHMTVMAPIKKANGGGDTQLWAVCDHAAVDADERHVKIEVGTIDSPSPPKGASIFKSAGGW